MKLLFVSLRLASLDDALLFVCHRRALPLPPKAFIAAGAGAAPLFLLIFGKAADCADKPRLLSRVTPPVLPFGPSLVPSLGAQFSLSSSAAGELPCRRETDRDFELPDDDDPGLLPLLLRLSDKAVPVAAVAL